ncbi:MAG: branched-chain amino acid ABC transporter substrate-binding protein, partial [Rubrivivax sp.]|nr:branched-chain amino acid ABC transporter substrate-binding protein [Rubrivivax sp.]
SFDNKLSPQETVNALQAAIDQGIRYVAQGTGTGPATAIIDFLNKYNERNPGKEVLFLNYAAVDPSLTNEKCSFWHFRLDADTSMKMEALTTFMKDQKDVKKVYLINQNYAHGHQVAKYAKENLARKRPDVQIVGEDLTPLAQTRDFAPYIAKIKASGADTVVTGNWSSDLTLLVKAANDAGLTAKFYTYYASVSGTPTAMGANAAGRVYQVGVMPFESPAGRKVMDEYKAKFNDDFYTAQIYNAYALLSAAIAKAKSTAPIKVAAALEGLEVNSLSGPVTMRKTDHQLQQTVFIAQWQKAGPKPYDYSVENTGYNFRTIKTYEPYVASTPTSCQMKRPAGL